MLDITGIYFLWIPLGMKELHCTSEFIIEFLKIIIILFIFIIISNTIHFSLSSFWDLKRGHPSTEVLLQYVISI